MSVLAVSSMLAAGLAAGAMAATPLSQGYRTGEAIAQGSIVSLRPNTTDEVQPASVYTADNAFGVTIDNGGSLLSITGSEDTQVQVATSGTVQVLVSDINGAVKRGDPITASPIAGVGMKATNNVRIIGMAQADASNGSKQTYKDKAGKEQSVNVGQVPVLVNVAYFFKEPDKTIIPAAIQSLANSIAGKQVDSLPILISAGIFIIMLIVVVSIVYAMIRSSIISIGRNPLSQSAVYRDLIQLSALVLAILAVGLVTIYLVLTRL